MAAAVPVAWLLSSECSQRQGQTRTSSLAYTMPRRNQCLPVCSRVGVLPQTNTLCFAPQSVPSLPTQAAQQQQWNVTRNQYGKRTRVDEQMQPCYGVAFRREPAPQSYDELYRHCLQQAEQLASAENSRQPSPLSVNSTSTAYRVAAATLYPFSSSTQLGDAHTTPPCFTASRIAVGAPRPDLPGTRYPVLSQVDHLHLASPAKRRRFSTDCGDHSNRFSLNNLAFMLEDPLLNWSKEQARQSINNDDDRRISTQSCSITSSPLEPFGQLVSLSTYSSTNVSDSLELWLSSLQISSECASSLAFHIWSRVAPQAARQADVTTASVVSACLWVSLKLQEHRLAVPSLTRLSQVCKVSRRELRRAEVCVMSWVDWAPLKYWLG